MEVDSCLDVPWRALFDEWVGLISTRDKLNLTLSGMKSLHSSDKVPYSKNFDQSTRELKQLSISLKKKKKTQSHWEKSGQPPESSSYLQADVWMKMVKFYIPSVLSLLVPPSLSFAGRTPIKMLNCFRGEQKSSSKLEVFHFSYKLSYRKVVFQIDLQPSPNHDNMPCGLGDSSVLNPVWIQEMSPYYDFQLRN